MDRVIRGPAAEHLTVAEFCALFGLSPALYDVLRARDVIPGPMRLTSKRVIHPWEHGLYFSLGCGSAVTASFGKSQTNNRPQWALIIDNGPL